MATHSGNRGLGYGVEVCGIFALLLCFLATNLQGRQTAFLRWVGLVLLRGRGVPGYPLEEGNNEEWRDLGDALAMRTDSGDLRISPNIDPAGQYNIRLVDQLPVIQDPMENIDADNAAAAEADLDMWLVVAEIVNLPRQIERDEANMMVRRPQVDDVAAGAPQHLLPQAPVPETVAADAPAPEVVGIEVEDEALAAAQVAMEPVPPNMLQLILAVASLTLFATPSMTVPAGGLESNLEERMPADHQEAGDSSADLQAEVNIQDDVENLEVGEPHAKGMQ